VADVMGISIGTVMSRLYYARQKLRAYLEQQAQL
jgi:DNA-directed RNA polymerase specialized sigma24 family protein